MDIKLKVRAEELGLSLDDISSDIKGVLDFAISTIADATYNQAVSLAHEKLITTQQDYIGALDKRSYAEWGSTVYEVSLGNEANWIEDGYCVLYCPNSQKIPKVHTSKGEQPLSEIKIGDYILNHLGEFTKVLKIYEKDYLEDCRVFNLVSKKYMGNGCYKKIFLCKRCGHQFERSLDQSKSAICPICSKKKNFVDIIYKRKKIRVTGEHKVLTKRGWVKANELNDEDYISIPAFNECKYCKKPTNTQFCSKSCICSYGNYKRMESGTHPSQREDAGHRWNQACLKSRKNNGLEAAFAFYMQKKYPDYNFVHHRRFKLRKDDGVIVSYETDFYFSDYNIAVEMDGEDFHNEEKDSIRDHYLKKHYDIETIRIKRKAWMFDYKKILQELNRRFCNHDHLYNFKFIKPRKIIKYHGIKNGFNTIKQWDITVENGSSFICQGFVIHNSSYDMKPGLLSGPKAKVSKDGSRYNIIPFQHKPSSKIQYGAGSRKQEQQNELRNVVKNYGLDKIIRGSRNKALQGKVKTLKALGIHNNLQGLTKYQKKYGKVTQSTYFTFRVVSDKSDPGSWMNPGYKGANIFPELEQFVSEETTNILQKVLG